MPIDNSSLMDQATTAGEKFADTADRMKSKMSELGRTAAERIDENRDAVAGGFEKTASRLHEKAGSLPGGEKVNDLAHAAAEKLKCTAGYVRDHNVKNMMADVGTLVKNNPGPSLLTAAIIGFVVGRAFTDND